MYSAYLIGSLVGFFWFMIIFLVLAVVFAKSFARWILYGIGSGFTFLSLLGRQRSVSFFGGNIDNLWAIYIILLAVGAFLIVYRRNK